MGHNISYAKFVTVLAVKGGKFEALEYVRTLFGVPRERCVAAGDSGNDILMLEGISPTNSWTQSPHSLRHIPSFLPVPMMIDCPFPM